MPGKRVLIVDDDATVRELVREILAKGGHEILEAANGAEAHERLAGAAPDIVLLDVMMPDLDGIALCREIRSAASTRNIPILMISALADSQTLRDALLFGATDYIVKPFDVTALENKVETMLAESRPRRAESA
jgi:DNA-binding response OmpR family regulator